MCIRDRICRRRNTRRRTEPPLADQDPAGPRAGHAAMTARSLEEALPKRHRDRAASVRDGQFAVETSDMGLDGILADHQFRSDPLVGVIRHQQGEDLALALSETQMRSWPE